MTAKEKREFIHSLFEGVEKSIVAKVDKMPEHWDGYELRKLVADTFIEDDKSWGSISNDRGRTARYRRVKRRLNL